MNYNNLHRIFLLNLSIKLLKISLENASEIRFPDSNQRNGEKDNIIINLNMNPLKKPAKTGF